MELDVFNKALTEQIEKLSNQDWAVGLCTTSPAGGKEMNYFSYPKKHPSGLSYLHLVLRDSDTAIKILDDQRFSKASIFVDVEKKNPDFSSQVIIDKLGQKPYHPIEPNALTVNALMAQILKHNLQKKLLIIGSGLIAQALCFRLSACHENFYWTALEERKGTANMHRLFPMQHADNNVIGEFDIVVNCVPVAGIFDVKTWIKSNGLFIDSSGVSLPELATMTCSKMRLDVGSEQLAYVFETLHQEKRNRTFGRGEFAGFNVCSGGCIGNAGDIVVDDFRNPSFVIGIADGTGGFKERHAVSFDDFHATLNR